MRLNVVLFEPEIPQNTEISPVPVRPPERTFI